MRLIYVTVHYPTAPGEEFLDAEVSALAERMETIVVPLRPRGSDEFGDSIRPLINSEIATAAARVFARRPGFVAGVVLRAVAGRGIGSAIKRLAVVPKSLWLSTRLHPGDHIHAAWGSAPATAALVAAAVAGSTYSFSVHRHDIAAHHALATKAKDATFVRAISETAKRQLGALVPAPAYERIHVVHLGILTPPQPAPVYVDPRFVVICPGALVARKNQATLLRALARSDGDVHLVFAGDGPDRPVLATQAAELGLEERVTFLGHVPHDDLLEMYRTRRPAAATLASLDEGLPIALVEALGAGIPIISSRVGAVAELVTPRVGVIVDDPFDVDAYAAAWRTIRGWDPHATGIEANRIAREGFSVDATVPKLIRLIKTPTRR